MDRSIRSQTLTVANSATTSTSFVSSGVAAVGLVVPAEFDGTAITFTVSADPLTVADSDAVFQPLYDITNTQVSMTVAASRSYDLPGELTAWVRWRIVCGTAQTGQTDFKVVGKS